MHCQVASIQRSVARWESSTDRTRPAERYQFLLAHLYARTPDGDLALGPGSDFDTLLDALRHFGTSPPRIRRLAGLITASQQGVVSTAAERKVKTVDTVRAAAKRAFFGDDLVTVAIPLRKGVAERERILIAAEDSATADQFEQILADQALVSARTVIAPGAEELPAGDAIVVCGPKSAPVGVWLLDRDPCLGMIEVCGQWAIFDRSTGERYSSPSDGPDRTSRDISYFARHVIDGRTVLHVAGIHAIGSLGMVHYLTHNLAELSSAFGDESFSLAVISGYDGLAITDSTLFLGPYRWGDI